MKLFLSLSRDFPRQFQVRCGKPAWRPKFEGIVSRFDTISPFAWEAFLERVEEVGAEVVWKDDPAAVFEWLDGLDADPGVDVISDMEHTYRGFFPFQIQGINFAADLPGALFEWSTGTGKTVGLEGIMLRKLLEDAFDSYIITVKRGNKTNVQRKLRDQAGIEATIINGDHDQREEQYIEAWDKMDAGEPAILIVNWEKWREDEWALFYLVEGRRVFVCWDEISDKIKNRSTQLWRSICHCFFTSFTVHTDKKGNSKNIYYPTPDKRKWRADHQFLATTATPIINSPMDYINIIHMLDPTIFGSIRAAEDMFVERRHKKYKHVIAWKNLDKLELMSAGIVHQVDKDDPDIARYFPAMMEEDVWIDLDPHDRALYEVLEGEYKRLTKGELSILTDEEILAAIGVMQMLCSNPRSVLRSAKIREDYEQRRRWSIAGWEEVGLTDKQMQEMIAQFDKREKAGSAVALKLVELIGNEERFTDAHSAKLDMLKGDLEKHDGKALVFTSMNDSLIPYLSEAMDEIGVSHVTYTGGMSDKALQLAQDSFKTEADVKVFLSSDAGSDSIDLEEADLCVDYDLPWTNARLIQRHNREHRITSTHEHVRVRRYLTPDTVEERRMEIITEKAWYQAATTGGQIKEQAATMRRTDLLYLLTGRRGLE